MIKHTVIAVMLLFVVCESANLPSANAQSPNPDRGLQWIDIPLREIVHENEINGLSKFYHKDHILSWSVYIPKDYDPSDPPGVIVYISPTRSGKPPKSWRAVFDQNNMIFISANNAGNRVPARQRISNAVFALSYVRQNYNVDSGTTILSGFSGGARMTSTIIEIMPNLFSGAILIGGAQSWQGDTNSMQSALSGGTYVFITGKRDHARFETRRTYRQYANIESANTLLFDTNTLGHELPSAKLLAKALRAFDRGENP